MQSKKLTHVPPVGVRKTNNNSDLTEPGGPMFFKTKTK
jgi:hypothetical protein